jgi:hypothetical protein
VITTSTSESNAVHALQPSFKNRQIVSSVCKLLELLLIFTRGLYRKARKRIQSPPKKIHDHAAVSTKTLKLDRFAPHPSQKMCVQKVCEKRSERPNICSENHASRTKRVCVRAVCAEIQGFKYKLLPSPFGSWSRFSSGDRLPGRPAPTYTTRSGPGGRVKNKACKNLNAYFCWDAPRRIGGFGAHAPPGKMAAACTCGPEEGHGRSKLHWENTHTKNAACLFMLLWSQGALFHNEASFEAPTGASLATGVDLGVMLFGSYRVSVDDDVGRGQVERDGARRQVLSDSPSWRLKHSVALAVRVRALSNTNPQTSNRKDKNAAAYRERM